MKRLKRLLMSKEPTDREKGNDLYKEIKRLSRRNKRRLQHQIADYLAKETPETECKLIKRALAHQGETEVAPVKVDPDDFTAFMESLQPPLERTPIV